MQEHVPWCIVAVRGWPSESTLIFHSGLQGPNSGFQACVASLLANRLLHDRLSSLLEVCSNHLFVQSSSMLCVFLGICPFYSSLGVWASALSSSKMGEAEEEKEVRSLESDSVHSVLLSLTGTFVKQRPEGARQPHNEYLHRILYYYFVCVLTKY